MSRFPDDVDVWSLIGAHLGVFDAARAACASSSSAAGIRGARDDARDAARRELARVLAGLGAAAPPADFDSAVAPGMRWRFARSADLGGCAAAFLIAGALLDAAAPPDTPECETMLECEAVRRVTAAGVVCPGRAWTRARMKLDARDSRSASVAALASAVGGFHNAREALRVAKFLDSL